MCYWVDFGRRILCVALLCMSGAGLYAEPVRYTIEQIGLTGAGYRSSEAVFLNEQGQVAGLTSRSSGPTYLGQDAWLHSGAGTIQIGLTGSQYTSLGGNSSYPTGFHDTRLSFLNNRGMVTGRSQYFLDNYGGGYADGYDVWLYNGNTTVQLGFTGVGYEVNRHRTSEVLGLNDLGQVVGASARFQQGPSNPSTGQDAWLYQNGNTVQLGFTGVGYEKANGFRNSYIGQLNSQGQVTGYSDRYGFNGDGTSFALGSDAWLYSGGNTVKIGLGTPQSIWDYNGLDVPTLLNEQGHVAGYHSGGNTGVRAWLYDGSSTVQIGFTGIGYQDHRGNEESQVRGLNDQGQAVGTSGRYDDTGTRIGQDTWLYSAGNTVRIGLTGPDNEDGSQYNNVSAINDHGHVVGATDEHAWFYDGSSTIRIGLVGAGYERADGRSGSSAFLLNDQDQVLGVSKRYRGDEWGNSWDPDLGLDVWLFDADLNQTFAITPSVRPSDNYAWSNAAYLGDDGLVLGEYSLFDQSTSTYLGQRAFAFTLEDGVQDLGLLVDDLTPDGWLMLATLLSSNGMGNIIGRGALSGGGDVTAYLLTPVAPVPIPAAAWLFGGALGLLGAALRR